MFEAKCYDMYGNSIDGFTQWDINQEIKIKLETCGDDHIDSDYLSIMPEVHFSNIKRDKALVVRATTKTIDSVVVDVPNILLTEPYPLLIYVYFTSSKDVSSQTTIARTEIPIRKRNEPHDYYYVENIERITAEMIKEEIDDKLSDKMDATFSEMQSELDKKTSTMQEEIDTFETDVNTSLFNTKKYVNEELGKVHDRMDVIEEDFSTTKKEVADALKEVKATTSDVEDLREFVAQAKKDSEVYHVEDQTLHAENINVAQNMIIGNFIWVNGTDGNMSLKWVGGDN